MKEEEKLLVIDSQKPVANDATRAAITNLLTQLFVYVSSLKDNNEKKSLYQSIVGVCVRNLRENKIGFNNVRVNNKNLMDWQEKIDPVDAIAVLNHIKEANPEAVNKEIANRKKRASYPEK